MTEYVVKRGDSLWKIATMYPSDIAGSTTNAKIDTLVAVNGIKNRNLIYVGQIIKFSASTSDTSSSTTATNTTTNTTNKVTIKTLALQSESSTGRDFFADWTWNKHGDQTKGYKVRWEWDVPDASDAKGYRIVYDDIGEITDTWSTYTIPDEYQKLANFVQVWVTPIANTYEVPNGDKTDNVPYWEEKDVEAAGKQYHFSSNPPRTPSEPTVEIDKDSLLLTVKYDEIKESDYDATGIKFNIIQDNTVNFYTTPNPVAINLETNYVAFQYYVPAGHTYKVRACSVNSGYLESGWSAFSNEVGTKPSTPTNLSVRRDTHVDEKNDTKTYSVFLEWTPVGGVTKYEVEYTNTKANFDTEGATISTATSDGITPSVRIGIDSQNLGFTYYFRVKAIHDTYGTSEPSNIVELPIGVPPGPPTTWSTSNSAFAGETTYKYDADGNKYVNYTPMELNWLHNPTDNSKQTYAQLSFNFNEEKDARGDFVWTNLEAMVNSTDINDTEEVLRIYEYGTAVSYKGNLYFKMDTNHWRLKNTKIRWRVRTAGVTDIMDNDSWSVERTIYIHEIPDFGLSLSSDPEKNETELIETFTSFPFYIRGKLTLTDYSIQHPVGYHVQIVSNNHYVTLDDVGRSKTINPGDSVYSKYFSTSENPLVVQLSADNIDLESNINYTIYCTADLSTGLAVRRECKFNVNWVDVEHAISADISINNDTYTAMITPYCHKRVSAGPGGNNLFDAYEQFPVSSDGYINVGRGEIVIRKINTSVINEPWSYNAPVVGLLPKTTYTISGNVDGDFEGVIYSFYGASIDTNSINTNGYFSHTVVTDENGNIETGIDKSRFAVFQNSGDDLDLRLNSDTLRIYDIQLQRGSEATKYEHYYETYDNANGLVDNVTLAIYRREYDGSYKEIASGIPNNYTTVTDPHPALDYARYRFTAKDTITGALSFWDAAAFPVNGFAVVIQWDEEWSSFDSGESTAIDGSSWSGSILKLPYNIKISDKRNREKTLINYAGREHPVSYYGTQLSETSTWNVDIPADDKDTIYALRRLSLWAGDVYVREPSGMGFWANVEVSFNKSYDDLKIPVTLSVTRVEGGI